MPAEVAALLLTAQPYGGIPPPSRARWWIGGQRRPRPRAEAPPPAVQVLAAGRFRRCADAGTAIPPQAGRQDPPSPGSEMDSTGQERGAGRKGTASARAEPAVSVRGPMKRYGSHEAVAGIDLDVRHGEIFACLGPNGAGKTTTAEILEGFRQRTTGEISVLGHDPAYRATTHYMDEAEYLADQIAVLAAGR